MSAYDIGALVVLQAVFTDPVTGAVVNPASPACYVKQPDQTEVVVTVTASSGPVTIAGVTYSAGQVYSGTFPPTQPGVHWYRFQATGTYQAAGEAFFTVRQRRG